MPLVKEGFRTCPKGGGDLQDRLDREPVSLLAAPMRATVHAPDVEVNVSVVSDEKQKRL
jgi:hypothetical protein